MMLPAVFNYIEDIDKNVLNGDCLDFIAVNKYNKK